MRAGGKVPIVLKVEALGIRPRLQCGLNSPKSAVGDGHEAKHVLRVIIGAAELHGQGVAMSIKLVCIVHERIQSKGANIRAAEAVADVKTGCGAVKLSIEHCGLVGRSMSISNVVAHLLDQRAVPGLNAGGLRPPSNLIFDLVLLGRALRPGLSLCIITPVIAICSAGEDSVVRLGIVHVVVQIEAVEHGLLTALKLIHAMLGRPVGRIGARHDASFRTHAVETLVAGACTLPRRGLPRDHCGRQRQAHCRIAPEGSHGDVLSSLQQKVIKKERR